MTEVQTWIEQLDLEEHPEGGYYRETYRTQERLPASALPERFDGTRNVAAHIYFLLPGSSCSTLHRIQQDEIWHFYAGHPLTLHLLPPEGGYQTCTLSRQPDDGHVLHTVVPAGTWFGATVEEDGGYALVGCTTAPAFDFADFELADHDRLKERYPQHRAPDPLGMTPSSIPEYCRGTMSCSWTLPPLTARGLGCAVDHSG